MTDCDVDEEKIVGAGMAAQPREGLLHVESSPLGNDAFGLLDHDAAVEGVVELLDHDVGLYGGAVLEDGDRGDIGKGLGGDDVAFVQRTFVGPEQVEGADGRAPQAHR
jgi:hypothetical protein